MFEVGRTYETQPEVILGVLVVTGHQNGPAEKYPLTIGIMDFEDDGAEYGR